MSLVVDYLILMLWEVLQEAVVVVSFLEVVLTCPASPKRQKEVQEVEEGALL